MLDPSLFDFELPGDLIAQRPSGRRRASRLLIWRHDGCFEHASFEHLPELFQAGDLLVLNDTRVFPARLLGRKMDGGGRVELLLVRALRNEGVWESMARPSRRLSAGSRVELEGGLIVEIGSQLGGGHREVIFPPSISVLEYCDRHGHVPLPPYIERRDEELDRERYQTVYARSAGSIAAPTAGLHFDDQIFRRLEERRVEWISLTLHVGPGTFRPIGSEELREGKLHPERYRIPESAMERLRLQRRRGGRIVVVGTTACRALETVPLDAVGEQRGETRLFIRPGFQFAWTDVLISNFHLPRSSLLMLVAALAGDRWKVAYRLAVQQRYRFYSYGDANWIER